MSLLLHHHMLTTADYWWTELTCRGGLVCSLAHLEILLRTHAQQYAKTSTHMEKQPAHKGGGGVLMWALRWTSVLCLEGRQSHSKDRAGGGVIRPLLPETLTAQTCESTLEQLMSAAPWLLHSVYTGGVMQAAVAEQQLQGCACIHTWSLTALPAQHTVSIGSCDLWSVELRTYSGVATQLEWTAGLIKIEEHLLCSMCVGQTTERVLHVYTGL